MAARNFFPIASLSILWASLSIAADKPLKIATVDLRNAEVQTFFSVMTAPQDGIKARLDADFEKPFSLVDVATFRERAGNFWALQKLERSLKGGSQGLDKIVAGLAGKSLKVGELRSAIMAQFNKHGLLNAKAAERAPLLAGALAPILALTSGKGVLVRFDEETYAYNFGYAKGTGGTNKVQDEKDRKTGRSYGASKTRNAYDPSDRDYLTALAKYAGQAKDGELEKFYQTVFEILLKCDTSGIKTLSAEGQSLISDFLAVYMAESDRHLMTNLTMYEWENALTEITLLAAFAAQKDGITLDPRGDVKNEAKRELVSSEEIRLEDRMLGFFGVGTKGSGLDGKNKTRRHNLTKQVVAEYSKIDPATVSAIEKIIGAKPGADIYDKVMEFINNFKTQGQVAKNADRLIELMVKFSMGTREAAAQVSGGVDTSEKPARKTKNCEDPLKKAA
jgi:hypothetical protein